MSTRTATRRSETRQVRDGFERFRTAPVHGAPVADGERPVLGLRFPILLFCFFGFVLARSLPAQERQGAYIEEIEDEDGDLVIIMETDWISMRLMPALGSTVIRFVFRPTQNDIVDVVQPKNLKAGGGILQDDLWEQDWRFQELRGKWYDYKITKRGPDEVQVVFETQLDGWIGAVDSGIISKLLEKLKIRRTVTLQKDTPYFLFDVEFINDEQYAKLPLYWCHNSDWIDITSVDHVMRPSTLGINEIPGKGSDYVYNFNKGWTARVSPTRKEGLVYLMDYDYLSFLYNCGTTTEEWVYDNLLVLQGRPVRTRIYVLPIMGLEKVDDATEYFITQVKPRREKDEFRIEYKVTASYQKIRRVTFVPELVYDLLSPVPKKATLKSVQFEGIGIEPLGRETAFAGQSSDPVVIRTTAFVELPDGRQVERRFEYFHIGDYSLGANVRKDMVTPVVLLEKEPQKPVVPVPSQDAALNRKDFRIFALLGANSRVLRLEEAIRSIPNVTLEVGYHPGFIVDRTGLTDFPYDYDRLFQYRVLVFNNSVIDTARFVGMSILANYLDRGGGLVFGGGDNVFGLTKCDLNHPVYDYIPIASSRITKRTEQVNSPLEGHPIFRGIDLANLPYEYFVQEVTLKDKLPSQPRVLLKVGDQPLIMEYDRGKGLRIMVLTALPYGDPAENPGKPHLCSWSEWPKLYANVVRYAAGDL